MKFSKDLNKYKWLSKGIFYIIIELIILSKKMINLKYL